MYTYHLWIVLAESTLENDTGRLATKVQTLEELIAQRIGPLPRAPINQVNYETVFQCSVSRNHRGELFAGLSEVLSWITQQLPGSYGLVYLRDDEDPELPGAFRVLVLARGRIAEHADPFLSPIVPTIED
jgi:hypothetical protein